MYMFIHFYYISLFICFHIGDLFTEEIKGMYNQLLVYIFVTGHVYIIIWVQITHSNVHMFVLKYFYGYHRPMKINRNEYLTHE